MSKSNDTRPYQVVINDQNMYSIWPLAWDLMPGWRAAGKTGLKDECFAYIREVWTDMQPLDLRKKLGAKES